MKHEANAFQPLVHFFVHWNFRLRLTSDFEIGTVSFQHGNDSHLPGFKRQAAAAVGSEDLIEGLENRCQV
jgi:hypothetical protein